LKQIGPETATRPSCGDARLVNAIRSSATGAAAGRRTTSIMIGLRSVAVAALVAGRPSLSSRCFLSITRITACWRAVMRCGGALWSTAPGEEAAPPRSIAPQQRAIHLPLGKRKTERMVPGDSLVCELVQRLAFFRSLDPLPAEGRLLARPPAPKKRSFVNSVITCIRPAARSASPPASFLISSDIPMPRRCCEQGLVFLS